MNDMTSFFSLGLSGVKLVNAIEYGWPNAGAKSVCENDEFIRDFFITRELSRVEFAMSFREIRHELTIGTSHKSLVDKLGSIFGKYIYTFHREEYCTMTINYICEELAESAIRQSTGIMADDPFAYCRKETAIEIIRYFRKELVKEDSEVADARLAAMSKIALPYYVLNCLIRPDANFETGMHRAWTYGMKAYSEALK